LYANLDEIRALKESLKREGVFDETWETLVIPHRLDELEAKDRLELLVKLMPYVFTKVQSVSQSLDKPMSW